jgi:hypothetical protein
MLAPAQAQETSTIRLEPTPLEMPRRIGPMRLTGEPHRYEQAALGVSYQYVGSELSLTVYVFDIGVTDIPDGGDTVPTCMMFEQAKQDLMRAGYADTALKSQQLVRLSPPDESPLAREAVFEYVRQERPTISYIWLTAAAKHFVKLRFSMSKDLRDESVEARRAILTALGDAIKPHLQPADQAGEKKSGPSLNLTLGGDEDDVAVGFMYQLLLSGLADKSPERIPVCGGKIEPDFETEVATLTAMAEIESGGGDAKFGKQLAAAVESGFTEELIWSEMHRETWGETPPEGLDLTGYQSWKKKNLKRFRRPVLGEVVISDPRPMPIEAPDAP